MIGSCSTNCWSNNDTIYPIEAKGQIARDWVKGNKALCQSKRTASAQGESTDKDKNYFPTIFE